MEHLIKDTSLFILILITLYCVFSKSKSEVKKYQKHLGITTMLDEIEEELMEEYENYNSSEYIRAQNIVQKYRKKYKLWNI